MLVVLYQGQCIFKKKMKRRKVENMKTCKNCIHMQQTYGDFVCANEDSEYLADFVTLEHFCPDYEGKENDDEE